MQTATHSTVVPSVSLSPVSPVRVMTPAERLDFEAAITRAFLSGKAYQRKLSTLRRSRDAA